MHKELSVFLQTALFYRKAYLVYQVNSMKGSIAFLFLLFFLAACRKEETGPPVHENSEISLHIPEGFPSLNGFYAKNKPTKYGVELGQRLFNEKKFSVTNTISCASCHKRENAFADTHPQGVGVYGRIGLRNTPPIQNLAFMKFYNWDGSKLQLEKQPLVPIITHEEMNSSILEVIKKLQVEVDYQELFQKTFGDKEITPDRIYKSIAQYEYTLISANSKYDRIKRKEGGISFTEEEERGFLVFQAKCETCHGTELFTDQSFRNVGFPQNPSIEEAGRARVTGNPEDLMKFRVPSLRNIEVTAPYGSFGQFSTLKEVLDYLDEGVEDADNLDPVLKEDNLRIPLSEEEKETLISFMKTLTDEKFLGL